MAMAPFQAGGLQSRSPHAGMLTYCEADAWGGTPVQSSVQAGP